MLIDSETCKKLIRRLRGAHLGRPLRFLDEVTSTNDVALEWSRDGAPEGAMVLASAQTRGRGRFGRSWHSAAGGGLWFSVILRPGLSRPEAGLLPLTAGAGLVLGLRSLGLPAALKWPNDVLVGGRKVAGVLVEGEWSRGCLSAAVVGVGVNWLTPDHPELAGRAGGLLAEFEVLHGETPLVPDVMSCLLAHVEQAYLVLLGAGPAPLTNLWPRLSAHFVRPARVTRPDGEGSVRGLAGGLHPDGALDILLPGGGKDRVHSGEVHLHPADSPEAGNPEQSRPAARIR